MARQHVLHPFHEIDLAELARAHVDGEPQASEERIFRPSRELGAGGLQDPVADAEDQAGLLGERNELHGRDQPARRVLPAHQRLGADRLAGAVHLHLVVQPQLAARGGMPQVAFERGTLLQRHLHRRVEEAHAVAARLLRAIHGGVRAPQRVVRRGFVAAEQRDADAATAFVRVAGRQRAGHRQRDEHLGRDAFGERAGGVPIDAQILGHHHELVAAQARDGVGAADAIAQAPRHFDQQQVADVVAARVVERLEVIQVDEEHGPVAAGAGARRERVLHAILQQTPVGQLGERVVEGEAADFLLGRAAVAHVVQRTDQMRDLALDRGDRGEVERCREDLAADTTAEDLALPVAGVRDRARQRAIETRVEPVRRDDLRGRVRARAPRRAP